MHLNPVICPFCSHIYGPTSLKKTEESSPTGDVQKVVPGSKRVLNFICLICGAGVELTVILKSLPTKKYELNKPAR